MYVICVERIGVRGGNFQCRAPLPANYTLRSLSGYAGVRRLAPQPDRAGRPKMRTTCLLIVLASATALGDFRFEDDGHGLTLIEDGKPIYVYRYDFVSPPEGVEEHFRRLGYLHPLYGLNGEILTQDFPDDHYHHRGVFWAWPECSVGERRLDVWALKDARQVHEALLTKEAGKDSATLRVQNAWVFDDAPDKPQVRETIEISALPAEKGKRALDFTLRFENVSGQTITFLGAENKGYGGLCFRPDKARKPMHFTTASGPVAEDQLRFDTPWADVSFEKKPDGDETTGSEAAQVGVAIFQHPTNPGYPHPGWIFRHYSFLGASWPHEETHVMEPGESFTLRYRLLVHRGSAEQAKVAAAFEQYAGKP